MLSVSCVDTIWSQSTLTTAAPSVVVVTVAVMVGSSDMDPWWVPIAVATITGPVVVLMRRFERRNTLQHDQNMETLQRIDHSVERVADQIERIDERLDDHIDWHLRGDERGSRPKSA